MCYGAVEERDKDLEVTLESGDTIKCSGIYCWDCSHQRSDGFFHQCDLYKTGLVVLGVDWHECLMLIRTKKCLKDAGHLYLLDRYIKRELKGRKES